MNITSHNASRGRRLIATGALGLAVALGMSGAIMLVSQPAQARAAEVEAGPPVPATSNMRALEQLANLVNGNHAAVAAALEPGLRPRLTPEAIGRAWADYQREFGAYRSHGAPVAIPRGAVTEVNVPLTMARRPGRFQITFNQAGQIAGIYLLRP